MGCCVGASAMYLSSLGNTLPVSFTAPVGANCSVVSLTDSCMTLCCAHCLFCWGGGTLGRID
eukprot:9474482-Ditylum_brightwellii.AAC.1